METREFVIDLKVDQIILIAPVAAYDGLESFIALDSTVTRRLVDFGQLAPPDRKSPARMHYARPSPTANFLKLSPNNSEI